jgi:DNA-directed RNA polymerase subunit RPC12/RpoP
MTMPVLFRCNTCERTLSTARRKTGMEITCPGCQSPVLVEPFEVLNDRDSELELARPPTSVHVVESPLPVALPPNLPSRSGVEPNGPRVFVADEFAPELPGPPGLFRAKVFAWLVAVVSLGLLGVTLYFLRR